MKTYTSSHPDSLLDTSDTCSDHQKQNPTRGEQALWRAVILQALEDAASNSAKVSERYHKTQALHWLNGTGKDFVLVCDYAGLDPEVIRKKIKQALSRGCKWRAEAGCGSKRTKKTKEEIQEKEKINSPTVHHIQRKA